jgi:prepilin-type N-terminal cleavage/methylation domain-containing protein
MSPPTSAAQHRGGARRAFTVVELLVTIAVLGILLVLLLPAAVYGRSLARDAICRSNLRQLWAAAGYYAHSCNGQLPVNLATPLRISNVVYKSERITGWGMHHPRFLRDYHVLFCPSDPGRGPAWEYGWSNWGIAGGEVQCSYGYRGRHGICHSPLSSLTLSEVERAQGKVFGCDFYEPFFAPPRIHHKEHINVLRASGSVERVDKVVSFGPLPGGYGVALDALDR